MYGNLKAAADEPLSIMPAFSPAVARTLSTQYCAIRRVLAWMGYIQSTLCSSGNRDAVKGVSAVMRMFMIVLIIILMAGVMGITGCQSEMIRAEEPQGRQTQGLVIETESEL